MPVPGKGYNSLLLQTSHFGGFTEIPISTGIEDWPNYSSDLWNFISTTLTRRPGQGRMTPISTGIAKLVSMCDIVQATSGAGSVSHAALHPRQAEK